MTNLPTGLTRLALASVFCLGTWTLSAAEIRDDAGVFSPEAVAKAKDQLNDIQSRSHHGVTIETYATVPRGRAKEVAAMSSTERGQFYSDWLKQRAKEARAEGIFVLITKDPGHVEVGVSGKLQAAGFTNANKQALANTFLTAFRAKEFDRGLADGVKLIEADYAKLSPVVLNAPRPTAHAPAVNPYPPAARSGGWSIGSILMIVAVVFVGMMVLSAVTRGISGGMNGPTAYGGGPAGYGGGYGGGGGGFGRGMLGGLLGGMAGSWLYDSFNHRSNSAFGGEQHPTQSPSTWGDSSPPSDDTWSTSGGDFGGGGGDFGGGDSGGGDSGGDF